MTLYSSEERRKPRCSVSSSYSSPSECGSGWRGEHLERRRPRTWPARCEARSPRPSSTSTAQSPSRAARYAEAAWATWCAHEADALRVEARQRGARKLGARRAYSVRSPSQRVGGDVVAAGSGAERGVVGVGDRVEVGGRQAAVAQAERASPAPGSSQVENGTGALAVLAPGEALLLGGGDDRARRPRARRPDRGRRR